MKIITKKIPEAPLFDVTASACSQIPITVITVDQSLALKGKDWHLTDAMGKIQQ